MDLEKIFNQVHELTLETGQFLRDEINNVSKEDIEVKGLHNFVTYVDKQSEKNIPGFSTGVPTSIRKLRCFEVYPFG